MGTFVERRWQGDPGMPGGRRARVSFSYRAFLPDAIASIEPVVSFDTAEAVAAAERAVGELEADESVSNLEAIRTLLLRSEAVASSRIEGFELSQRNLARALIEPRAARGTARTVAANVVAMELATSFPEGDRPIEVGDILKIHRTVMVDAPARLGAGSLRREQNWIGGRLGTPRDARYVPPPETELPQLMADLCAFMSREDIPAVAQAALAHAQFETIHPFVDGNGRVGRCLTHVIFRRRGLVTRFVPPVSIALAAKPGHYVDGLVAFREGRHQAWLCSFAGACERAAAESVALARSIRALQDDWHERAGRPRRDSAAARILRTLPAQPITSAGTIRSAIGASHQRALDGLKVLERAGILRQLSAGRYDRQYAADELFELLDAYEERIAGHG
jgi:Fic family protein